jgi:hypothetical protein
LNLATDQGARGEAARAGPGSERHRPPGAGCAGRARPLLGSEGFSDERIDELADAFVDDRIGEGAEQFVRWAMAEGPIGLDPEEGF